MSRLEQILALAGRIDEVSYYELLGVPADAPIATIVERYYLLAQRLHPDRFARSATPEQMATLNRLGARLGEARRVLSSPEGRANYDEGLARGELRRPEEPPTPGAKRKPPAIDPQHPLARQLFEAAQKLADAGNTAGAVAKLKLARQYQPDSAAIDALFRNLEPPAGDVEAAPTSAAEPEPAPTTATEAPQQYARWERRYPASITVFVRALGGAEETEMLAVDLSRSGAYLQTATPPDVGTVIELRFPLSDGSDLSVGGRVVRASQSEQGTTAVGIDFLEMPARSAQLLSGIIDSLSAAGPLPEPGDSPLSLEELVSQLVRVRSQQAHEILELPKGCDSHELDQRYTELARRYSTVGNYGADADAAAGISRELLAHLKRAYQEMRGRRRRRADTAKPERPPSLDDADIALEVQDEEHTPPPELRPARQPLPGRDLLSPEALRPDDPAAADESEQLMELVREGKYAEVVVELEHRLQGGLVQRRLRAVLHLARGYLAQLGGNHDLARREFETVLAHDNTCREAILELRNAGQDGRGNTG